MLYYPFWLSFFPGGTVGERGRGNQAGNAFDASTTSKYF